MSISQPQTRGAKNVLRIHGNYDAQNKAAALFILQNPKHWGEGLSGWARAVLCRLENQRLSERNGVAYKRQVQPTQRQLPLGSV